MLKACAFNAVVWCLRGVPRFAASPQQREVGIATRWAHRREPGGSARPSFVCHGTAGDVKSRGD
eukprot:7038498-Lingulodinium_polyedra.AAC.1